MTLFQFVGSICESRHKELSSSQLKTQTYIYIDQGCPNYGPQGRLWPANCFYVARGVSERGCNFNIHQKMVTGQQLQQYTYRLGGDYALTPPPPNDSKGH